MGGRGRGRGGANSGGLTFEQLQSLGVTRGGDVGTAGGPAGGAGPPPLFPKLESRPLPLQCSASMDYMLILKRQFLDFIHDSPSYVQTPSFKSDIERYSDKYKVLSSEGKNNKVTNICWEHLPTELRPHYTRKGHERKRKAKIVDIDTKLKRLEQKELTEKEGVKSKSENQNEEVREIKEEGDEDEAVAEEEDPDDEMDDGTDYVDNYFDNGEGFEDEDENLDDGPVY